MKRTPLKRSAMRRKSRRPPTDVAEAIAEAYRECHRRPNCQAQIVGVCTGRNEHAHHRKLRSQQGATTGENLLAVCLADHTAIHNNPDWAYRHGLLIHSWADSEAVDVHRCPLTCTERHT